MVPVVPLMTTSESISTCRQMDQMFMPMAPRAPVMMVFSRKTRAPMLMLPRATGNPSFTFCSTLRKNMPMRCACILNTSCLRMPKYVMSRKPSA